MFRLVNGEVVISVSVVAEKMEAVVRNIEGLINMDKSCGIGHTSPFICSLIQRMMSSQYNNGKSDFLNDVLRRRDSVSNDVITQLGVFFGRDLSDSIAGVERSFSNEEMLRFYNLGLCYLGREYAGVVQLTNYFGTIEVSPGFEVNRIRATARLGMLSDILNRVSVQAVFKF